ncbi:MAG: DUF1294 domain-containing protein [Bacillota bacterium]
MDDWLWLALASYNLLVLAIYALDKARARRGRWRIAEATLLWLALPGGGAGALAGVYLVRHKSRKPRFALGVPLIFLAQAALALWYLGLL